LVSIFASPARDLVCLLGLGETGELPALAWPADFVEVKTVNFLCDPKRVESFGMLLL
jgi:hypothetical protein